MKMTKKFITIFFLLAVMLVTFVACAGLGNDKKKEYEEPTDLKIEVTATTIEVIDDYTELCANGEVLEYRLEENDWQDSPKFEGLEPNTTYNVYIRVKENGKYKASKEHKQQATTLKLSQNAPNVTFEQVEKTVTVQADENLEYSFDGGKTYGTENTHTYTEIGDKIIKVRYKETDNKYSGKAQEIKVKITNYYGGTGEESDPYLIYTEEHFKALKYEEDRDVYFKLMQDLDFASKTFVPVNIGGCTFDGNNHKIENIHFANEEEMDWVAVFAQANMVKNLTLNNIVINYTGFDSSAVPSIALLVAEGENVENCKVSGEININNDQSYGSLEVGGLVGIISVRRSGKSSFNISDSSADVKIRYNSQSGEQTHIRVGGLLGNYVNPVVGAQESSVTISKCYTKVDIDLTGLHGTGYAAGLVGHNIAGKIENCYTTGKISTNGRYGSMSIGGLMAQDPIRKEIDGYRFGNGNIESCYATMELSADKTNQSILMGGISSLMQAIFDQTVKNCFFTGTMSITGSSNKNALKDSFTTSVSKYSYENCYHSDNLVASIGAEKSTAVADATIKTAEWQRDTLKFNEDVWDFVDGQYPTLK